MTEVIQSQGDSFKNNGEVSSLGSHHDNHSLGSHHDNHSEHSSDTKQAHSEGLNIVYENSLHFTG